MIDFRKKRNWGPEPKYGKVLDISPSAGKELIVVAGPCSVESPEHGQVMADFLSRQGVEYARGGVFRAGTYPGLNFGFQRDLALEWSKSCRSKGLKVVMEVLDVRHVGVMDRLADALQVGARHMQDYALLVELRNLNKPIFLKRNMGATLDEFLGAVEYLLHGNCKPILIERGGSTHMNHVRWDLSISLIAAVKKMTGIPIIVDASHGTGRRDLVEPMTLAGIAAGADGYLVETHPNPEGSLSDADQAISLDDFVALKAKAEKVFQCL